MSGKPYPVGSVTGLFNEVFDSLDVLRHVADGSCLQAEILNLIDLIQQRGDSAA